MPKIYLAQINPNIGDLSNNFTLIKQHILAAQKQQADVVLFPELALCGFSPEDLLFNQEFLSACEGYLQKVTKLCADITCIIGAPVLKENKLFNAAVCIVNKEIKGYHFKNRLSNQDVLNESRYFSAHHQSFTIQVKGVNMAITLGEDIWETAAEKSKPASFFNQLKRDNIELIVNLAACPFTVTNGEKRKHQLEGIAKDLKASVIFLNQVGANTDLIYQGQSLVFNKQGQLTHQLASFKEDSLLVNLSGLESRDNQHDLPSTQNDLEILHQALVFGIREYFSKNNFKKAIIGLSGGLDSALVAALVAEALGGSNLHCVLMPSEYSSSHSIKDALDLVNNIHCSYDILAINELFDSFKDTLSGVFSGLQADSTEENIQARIRGVLLMAISNKKGYVLLNTSNKSEAAVGYGTLYGDMCGSLSVIGDVFKSQAYDLAKYINRDKEIIPTHTITKPPSAELRPDQLDADSLPDYNILDPVLKAFIEDNASIKEVVEKGYEKEVVEKIGKLLTGAEFKRKQSPPVLRVSEKSFGSGRRFALSGKRLF